MLTFVAPLPGVYIAAIGTRPLMRPSNELRQRIKV